MPREPRSPSPTSRDNFRSRKLDDRESFYKRHRDRDTYDDYETTRRRRYEDDGDFGRAVSRRVRDERSRREYNHDKERRKDRDDRDRRGGPSSRRPSASPRRTTRTGRSRSRSQRPRSRSRSQSHESEKDKNKGKPNFNQSGLLAAETNKVNLADGTSTVLKYNEPPEARKPLIGWRLYIFKGKEQTDLLHIQRQSAYLIGRDKAVVDIYVEHPSCSKQHAVIQYRQVQEKDEFGSTKSAIKPFIIDLESTNGTSVNEETIPAARYYELKMGDIIRFGQSTRDYVLLHDDA